jgi:hypothetical protein
MVQLLSFKHNQIVPHCWVLLHLSIFPLYPYRWSHTLVYLNFEDEKFGTPPIFNSFRIYFFGFLLSIARRQYWNIIQSLYYYTGILSVSQIQILERTKSDKCLYSILFLLSFSFATLFFSLSSIGGPRAMDFVRCEVLGNLILNSHYISALLKISEAFWINKSML